MLSKGYPPSMLIYVKAKRDALKGRSEISKQIAPRRSKAAQLAHGNRSLVRNSSFRATTHPHFRRNACKIASVASG